MQAPGDTQRLAVIGRTGTGKTQAALFHLSRRRFDLMPWIIFDFKRDPLLKSLRLPKVKLGARPPARPGVYLVQPKPHELEGVENYLWRIWDAGKTGVYIDEGYMMGQRNPAFRALLTQGRSKYIPMIVLSQRPVWMDKFVWSESDYFQVFHLNDVKDRDSIRGFLPEHVDLEEPLARYHSHFYSVADHEYQLFSPVPDMTWIREEFKRRLKTGTKIL